MPGLRAYLLAPAVFPQIFPFPLRIWGFPPETLLDMPQLWTLALHALHLVTHHHVDNSPIQAIAVDIQPAGSQWGPLSDRTAGPQPMTES